MDENPYLPPNGNDSSATSSHGRQQRFGMGMVALLLAILSSTWLLVAAAHVRADRTNRIPVVTSDGPFAGHITEITFTALGLSFVALILSYAVMAHAKRSVASAMFAIAIALASFMITVFFVGAMYED